jgi:hypothetical protein
MISSTRLFAGVQAGHPKFPIIRIIYSDGTEKGVGRWQVPEDFYRAK